MQYKLASIATFWALISLVACGGGGGDTPTTDVPANPGTNAADPNKVITTGTRSYDLRWGTPATVQTPATADVRARMVAKTMTMNLLGAQAAYPPFERIINFDNTRSLTASEVALLGVWLTPEVKAAWAQGWTGAGIKTGVMDDFTPNDTSEFLQFPITLACIDSVMPGGNVNLCRTQAKASLRMTHGDTVVAVLGNAMSAFTGKATESGNFTSSTDSGTFTGSADLAVTFSTPYYGIAKDALVVRSDFLSYQSRTTGLFSVLREWGAGADLPSQVYNQRKVINLSMSGNSTDEFTNKRIYDAQLAFANTSFAPDSVYVKAAGNLSCVTSEPTCDPINRVFYNAPTFKDKTILVGALDQAGGALASYSNKAGNYADRFVVADGRGAQLLSDEYEVGTSFAAPRVAGYIAIIRQKFPHLSAADAARVILDTAVWNPAWGVKTAATQAIYGQGEASLARALAPGTYLR